MTDADKANDAELLQGMARGEEEAFVTLFRRYQGPVFRFALHMTGRREIAEEITQEVFLEVIREPGAFRSERGEFSSFLIGITRNKVRRQIRGRLWSGEASPGKRGSNAEETASSADPLGDLMKTREEEAVRRAVLALPVRYREVTVLCDLNETGYGEAAQVLGCAVGTVRSRLHRARKLLQLRLRKILRGEECSV